jgi:tRNA (guanine10-N2)-dimethyltransferase
MAEKWFFILGRNPALSRAEIFAYLSARGAKFKQVIFEEIFLVLEIEANFNPNVQELGGVMKLGKIAFDGKKKEFLEFLDKNEVVPADKFSYAVLGNMEDDAFIEKFKADKKRAMIRRGGRLKLQEGEVLNLPNADYDIFCYESSGKKYFLGVVEQNYDYKDLKERDMTKPVRREALAISPRLAKILINLSGVKENEILLDAFCGIGVILQEGLIKKLKVIGVDKDTLAIKDAKKNILWLCHKYKIDEKKFILLNLDSAKLPRDLVFNGIASEPALGDVVRRKLNPNAAKIFIQKFENLIIPILKRLKEIKRQNTKIAITFPFSGDVSVDYGFICKRTGLRILESIGNEKVSFPIKEFRAKQFVSREIVVFE